MKQSLLRDELTWLARCRIDNCNEQRVKCPSCKKYGHVAIHKKEGKLFCARISIQHSHFVEEQDAGRNIFCYPGDMEELDGAEIKKSWSLRAETIQYLKAKYAGFWKK